MRFKLLLRLSVLVGALLGLLLVMGASADTVPTGEVHMGQSTIEPAYDDVSGKMIFLLTPDHAREKANAAHAVAPLYLIMYPTSAAGSVPALNCMHTPMDNCPDHGPLLAGLAAQVDGAVYGGGVLGHDHILAGPASGGDFNIAWLPEAVLFTSKAAANTHITTKAQMDAAIARGDMMAPIPLPQATFHCSVVPGQVFSLGTPVTPVAP